MTSLCGLFMVTVRQQTTEEFPHCQLRASEKLLQTLTDIPITDTG